LHDTIGPIDAHIEAAGFPSKWDLNPTGTARTGNAIANAKLDAATSKCISGEFFITISDFIVIGLVLGSAEGWSVVSSCNKTEGSFDQPKDRDAADGVSQNVLAP
jgi:hypothetical protein